MWEWIFVAFALALVALLWYPYHPGLPEKPVPDEHWNVREGQWDRVHAERIVGSVEYGST